MRFGYLLMIALFAGSAADAQRQLPPAIWPKQAAALPPITLGEMIASALPRGPSIAWDAMQIPAVRWISDGIEVTPTGYSLRMGVARIRAAGATPMMLRQGWVELGWSIQLESSGNARFGAESVTFSPGMTDPEHVCFGARFRGCSFPASAMNKRGLSLRKVCERGPEGEREIVFAAASAAGRAGTVVYRTDAGSGDSTNVVVVVPGPASGYCAAKVGDK